MDSAHQNAACELNPNSESPQALEAVRPAILRQRCRTGPWAVGIGPVPGRCQGTVCCSTGEVIEVGCSGRSSATVADWSAGLCTCSAAVGGTRIVSSATGAAGTGRDPTRDGSRPERVGPERLGLGSRGRRGLPLGAPGGDRLYGSPGTCRTGHV